ncbi:S-methyl-5'-thioadenosine phosphorylase [Gordonia sp. OPL2]|uniref:S-methyl-5'-thioadenosine phosphorylase n=1 Tax=Gordonia sp. OPL2 TaxID=2486274 RepID=UPI0016559522|nr:S-methyl-5'-thioadenosine phosphorylase [Gordonia sp. OPL2]ROZ98294.1 S-methyl-5'-thioadenosine phosphorylase [Gordonia sp. OPL2]
MDDLDEHPDGAIGVIGGSGFYTWLAEDSSFTDVSEHRLTTPFGDPSAPLTVGRLDGRRIVFLPRHGVAHEYLPHRLPYRANLWAMHELGVRKLVSASAVGSLEPGYGPGTVVVPDQLVDRTSGRDQTFFDRVGATSQQPIHVSFADPYCPALRAAMVEGSSTVRDGGTLVVIDGPRFSTRAESRWYAAQGWSVINMTGHPEAVLARELQICYATACLVTDLDAGVSVGTGVTADEVFAEFARNLPSFAALLVSALRSIDPDDGCECATGDHDVELALKEATCPG